MSTVVVWWVWMEVIGLAALPLAYRFFRRLPDRGYAFARPLGLLLVSFVLWMGGSLGLLRNSVGGALFSIVLVAVVSLIAYWRGRAQSDSAAPVEGDPGLLAWLRANGRLVLSVELLYAGALALWSLMRAYSPEITTAGGEKFMEIMYLNSIGRSDAFPPQDAWLSGYGISYYYFGYVMAAMLTRLSGLAAHLTFNVSLASLFALTCTGAFGLVYDLVKGAERVRASESQGRPASPIAWGFLGAILVAVLGNLEGFLEVLYSAHLLPPAFWQWLDIEDINQPFNLALPASLMPNRSGWWWWRASRVIQDLDPTGAPMGIQPIDEFPGFSFLLGDVHPHVLALPFVLLALALALNALLAGAEERGDDPGAGGTWAAWLEPVKRLPLLVPLCLGALGFLNTWDFPIYLLVFVAAHGLGRWEGRGRLDWPLLRDVGLTGLTAGVLGFAFYLPFYIGFQSQAGGVLPTIYVGTRFRQYFVMFGPFLVPIAGLLTYLVLQVRRQALASGHRPASSQGGEGRLLRRWAAWTAVFVLVPLALMFLIVFALLATSQGRDMLEGIRHIPAVYQIVGDDPWPAVVAQLVAVKLQYWVMPLLVAALAALGVAVLQETAGLRWENGERRTSATSTHHHAAAANGLPAAVRFVLLCAVAGLLLTLSVEFFYLIDNFQVRMNTIFKFYFQGWVLMAVASAFAVYWLSRARGRLRSAFLASFWLLFALGMVYPVLGNISRAGNFAQAPTLDGTAYLAEAQADDYAAIAWLNEHVDGAPIILEAPATGGSSYVYEGRVSALTGLPTLLGWAGHEGQWRGSYDIQQAREPDIATLYNSLDPQVALTLLDKYELSYVYVGPVERNEYDPRGLEKFARFMDVVYQQGAVTIYRVRK
jgi:YYY domain-containing protein